MSEQLAPSVVFYAAEKRLSDLVQVSHRIEADIKTAQEVLAMHEEQREQTLAMMQDLAEWLGNQHSEAESDPDAYFRTHKIPKPKSAGGAGE